MYCMSAVKRRSDLSAWNIGFQLSPVYRRLILERERRTTSKLELVVQQIGRADG